MKTKILTLTIFSLWSIGTVFAQDRTTVTANNSEISDNLDLRAVASIFGDSENLADFERRLNDPKIQISNLDLNNDNKVDYLRVIETIEGNAHIIVIQSVLGRDTYQDIATVEVDRDRYNNVQVQVVGDVYMYGNNYIYEPVYAYTPVIYTSFWVSNYRPYCSTWYWGYYPAYYYAWSPCPIYSYVNHINVSINFYHHYNYVNYRRCEFAYNSYYRGGRRGNGYEMRYPSQSFSYRNNGYTNRYELDQNRNTRNFQTRNGNSNYNGRNYNNQTRSVSNERNQNSSNFNNRYEGNRTEPYRCVAQNNSRNFSSHRNEIKYYNPGRRNENEGSGRSENPRVFNEINENQRNYESPRSFNSRSFSENRGNSSRGQGNMRSNRRS